MLYEFLQSCLKKGLHFIPTPPEGSPDEEGSEGNEQISCVLRTKSIVGSSWCSGDPMTCVGPSPVPTVSNRLSHSWCQGESALTPPADTMARSRVLLLLLLLPPQLQLGPVLAVRAPVFGRNGAQSLSPEENEFMEEEPVLVLSPEEPGPGPATVNCPRDCACSQEGVVDCGGIDLREFPGDLPEHTNHLSLQVRLALHHWSPGAAPTLMAPVHSSLLAQIPQALGVRTGQTQGSDSTMRSPHSVRHPGHRGP